MYVPPWTILSGLGSISRGEMCNLIATFEETTLLSVTADSAIDQFSRLRRKGEKDGIPAFARRVEASAREMEASEITTRALRIRLWFRISTALDADPALPFSAKAASRRCAALSFKAAAAADPLETKVVEEGSFVGRTWRKIRGIGKREKSEFAALVSAEAQAVTEAIAALAGSDAMSPEQMAELDRRIREHIEKLPPELQDEAMRKAMKSGDGAALALLASGTSLLGVGVGVHLAGFSAYVLATQAAAFIPLLSGPAAVSTLFMLANPLFSVPALLGGAWFLNSRFSGSQMTKLASQATIHLALRGLAAEKTGLATALADFRTAQPDDLIELPARFVKADTVRRSAMRVAAVPSSLDHGRAPEGSDARLLDGVLSRSRGDLLETSAVGAMTAADMIYNVVLIDPTVLKAADFARSDDISDIFTFGAFADRLAQMTQRSQDGAENGLRGYVAEQIVAARLVESGHIVSLPPTSNNPGFDVIVDGNLFQVKCLTDLDGLREHFLKYPEIPVYANGELAEAILASGEDWAEKVFYVEGFDREIADLVMRAALDAGAELGDLNVPYFAMTVSSARNLYTWWKGRMPLADVPMSIIVDSGIKGGLAAAGGISGKLLGLAAFGPAGALVLGGALGVGALLGTGWMKDQTTRLLSSEWADALDVATERLRVSLIREIGGKIASVEDRLRQVKASENRHRDWLAARFHDDILALREASFELEGGMNDILQPARAARCLEIMKEVGVHPLNVQTEQVELLRTMSDRPSLAGSVASQGLNLWDKIAVPTGSKVRKENG
ncbi:hypothetical protein G6L37_04400 [Agrobacterium rubi]|nr:hypothetical protein [Agrobacterium rubi]NTF24593.1 hypothetical protein [Agrobacterium rubi]